MVDLWVLVLVMGWIEWETIMDYDRVLVLNEGVVIEDDTPKALIAKEGSQFGMMHEAHQQGRSLSSSNLQAMA